MGHLMKRTLLRARRALDALTLAADGVDGKAIYMYGEGWDYAEARVVPGKACGAARDTGREWLRHRSGVAPQIRGPGQEDHARAHACSGQCLGCL